MVIAKSPAAAPIKTLEALTTALPTAAFAVLVGFAPDAVPEPGVAPLLPLLSDDPDPEPDPEEPVGVAAALPWTRNGDAASTSTMVVCPGMAAVHVAEPPANWHASTRVRLSSGSSARNEA